MNNNIYLRCYKLALKASKWWWSERKIANYALIFMVNELEDRLSLTEQLLNIHRNPLPNPKTK